jgi:tetratricopeptide (TPR) repeat protein
MSAQSAQMAVGRHPWIARFESAPERAFADLLSGYAEIHPYERADAPDAARMLFGPLDPDDTAREALGPAILAWLEIRRKELLPAARPKLQRRVREICEAFEIVALLDVADAAVELRRNLMRWNDWVAGLALSTTRDARAEYWRMLALTQPLVKKAASQDLGVGDLSWLWQRICRESGGRLPRHYLSIGLLGLRRLPENEGGSEVPWVAGLAQWALAQNPSAREFKAEWLALKPLYPRAPQRWRRMVAKLLSAPTYRNADIAPPGMWAVDIDFAPLSHANFVNVDTPLRSPSPQDCDRVIEEFANSFERVGASIDKLLDRHRRYLNATGDAQYFVRAIHALGRAMIERGGDNPRARARKAQALAREGLDWQPYDRYLWALWRDAFAADDAVEVAELIGWEMVRRDPTHVDARTQLATLLADLGKFDHAEMLLEETIDAFPDNAHARNQLAIVLVGALSKRDEAEALLRETIERFPNDAFARNELGELLILRDRLPEATAVLDAALKAGAKDGATYGARARLYSHEGHSQDALHMIEEGLKSYPANPALKQYKERLRRGEKLSLTSRAFQIAGQRPQLHTDIAPAMDSELAEAVRLGAMRRLRFQLEFAPDDEQQKALEELKRILREDPTFAYAELLAARHRIWEARAEVLPSVAAAFEDALETEDREKLERLAARQPRLEALILVARALFGDAEAQRKVELWLRDTHIADKEPAIVGLHSALRPVLRVIEGGLSPKEAFIEVRNSVVNALHDANEATLGEPLLAA